MVDLTTESGRSYEPPANDPFALTLSKKGSIKGESINGAIFELTYYDNTDNDASGEAYRTWYFMTDEDGELNCRKEEYLLDGDHMLNDGSFIVSDALYYDNNGEVTYPVGTYLFREIQSGDEYKLDGGEMWPVDSTGKILGDSADVVEGIKVVLKRNDTMTDGKYGNTIYYNGSAIGNTLSADNFSINATNDGTIELKVIKLDASTGKPLPDVTFRLVGDDKQLFEATTDVNGEIVFEELIPQHYVLTEIDVPKGYTLLSDNIDITVPIYMTETEIKDNGADKDQAEYSMTEDKFFFTKVTYTIGNTTILHVPMTGVMSSPKIYIPLFCGLALAGAASVYIFGRKKRRKQQAES